MHADSPHAPHPLAPIPDPLFADVEREKRWQARFSAPRCTLPDAARDCAEHTYFLSNQSGTFEIYTWNVATGEQIQATARANGTTMAELSANGLGLWWFDDTDGDEFGRWMAQPFGAGPGQAGEAIPGTPPGYPAGLEIGITVTVVGFSDADGTRVHCADAAGVRVVYRHEQDAHVGPLSADETMWVLAHSEHGDSRYPALRVLAISDGTVLGELDDNPGKGLSPLEFSPIPGDERLLVGHERNGRDELLLWDLGSGSVQELHLDLPGDVTAAFTKDAAALLVLHTHAGRTGLYRYDFATAELAELPTGAGVVSAVQARPDGQIWYQFSTSAQAATLLALTAAVNGWQRSPLPTFSLNRPPDSEPVTDMWVDGPGGRIHALVARPADAPPGPRPTVFYVHGGPAAADEDRFDAGRASWLEAGFAVVNINYRGSTGYGSAWRDANTKRIGHTELADIAAVYDAAVAAGVADGTRCVIAGDSWGGYLTLLALGTQPTRWAAGIAGVPVADYVAAYHDEMEPLRAYDRAMFGGCPQQVPEKYTDSSPLTWIDGVVAPVCILVGVNDPRCPSRQVDNYLNALRDKSKRYALYRFDAGHGSMVVDERIRQMAVGIGFAMEALGVRSARQG